MPRGTPSNRKNLKPQAAPAVVPATRYLTVQGAAAYLSSTVWAIRQLIAARKIPHSKIGKRHVLDTHDLDAFVESVKVAAEVRAAT